MAARIIIFGATGFTGRQVAERLVAQGAAPVLAGRSEGPVRELAERLGVEWRTADALRRNSVFALLERGDVLVSTVGPFAKWGEPAVRAAIAAHGTYIDSTGEPSFIRRVFEEFGAACAPCRRALLTAMGYDFVPGALAAALALEEAGERGRARRHRLLRARRRDQRRHAALGGRRDARREPHVPGRRAAPGPHGRARALVHRARQAARGDVDRRRRAPGAAGRRIRGCARSTSISAGSAGSRGRCRRRAWPARWRCACRACAA